MVLYAVYYTIERFRPVLCCLRCRSGDTHAMFLVESPHDLQFPVSFDPCIANAGQAIFDSADVVFHSRPGNVAEHPDVPVIIQYFQSLIRVKEEDDSGMSYIVPKNGGIGADTKQRASPDVKIICTLYAHDSG